MPGENDSLNKAAGDVDNIRKILFGDQINQIEDRFNQIEASIAQLRKENNNLRQALETELSMREDAVRELKNQLNSDRSEQNNLWNKNLADQEKLIITMQKALEQFKQEIRYPPEDKK
jgi:septation ring formation regulator EzrA